MRSSSSTPTWPASSGRPDEPETMSSSDRLVRITDAYINELIGDLSQARHRLACLAAASSPQSLEESPQLAGAYKKFVGDWSDKREELGEFLEQAAEAARNVLHAFNATDQELARELRE